LKLLVLGSDGFIGSNAVRYFKERGHLVHSADILIRHAADYTPINPEFADFGRLFHNKPFDVCINATGAANVQFSFDHAAMDYTLNVSNVFHILEALRQFNPQCKFINFSSAAVYGSVEYLPIDEKHPIKPLSPYGLHKHYSELVCKEFFDHFGMQTLSLRAFSAYGPGLKKQLFWDVYQKALKGKEIQLFGTGEESRDFIYIDDILQAIELLIAKAEFKGQTVNVANGVEVRIGDAVKRFLVQLGYDCTPTYSGQLKVGDPPNWCANIDMLRQHGYQQSVLLDEGLKKYSDWVMNFSRS